MNLSKILKNTFLVILLSMVVSACATKKTATIDSQIQGDVYTGTDTVEYLAKGVPDRVFFATNESILTTMSRDTLRKQAAWLRDNPSVNVVLEGHADEREIIFSVKFYHLSPLKSSRPKQTRGKGATKRILFLRRVRVSRCVR